MPDVQIIENNALRVSVSSLGGEMQSLNSVSGKALLWHGDSAWWSGRSPVLFPIVGKAPDDEISVDGKRFAMAQHGFARRREFTLIAHEKTFIRHELRESEETLAHYPFAFSLVLEHRLEENSLSVTATVTNKGEAPMPYGLGFHPAFLWPLPGAEGADHEIVLKNGAEPVLTRLQSGLYSDAPLASPFVQGRLQLDQSQFAADAMIFAQGAGDGLTYQPVNGPEGTPRLDFAFHNLPNLALWQKPGAPFICIEPWHGMAAALGKGPELSDRPFTSLLAAGEKQSHGFTVTVL